MAPGAWGAPPGQALVYVAWGNACVWRGFYEDVTPAAHPRHAGHGSQAVQAMAIRLPGVDSSLSQVQPPLSSELLD
jgi:hypothetical protein